ncbi:restriction endonuclease subunit S [Staphylococcus aureus]|uniref:restriction endonuclease subunit S n=1 Tax=Staphylococcus aureus TaxID=1280 RepID=UPI0039E6EF93
MSNTQKKNVPELRFPGFEGEWEEKQLGDLTTKIGSGKTPKGGSENYTNKGIPFLRSQNIRNGKLNLNDLVYISKDIDDEMKNCRTYYGDVLLNITGASIGRTAINSIVETHANLNQHVCIIRLKKEYYYIFFGQYLLSRKGKRKIFLAQSGGSREGLNFKEIANLKIFTPTIFEEQQKIGKFFSKLDRQIELEEQKLELLQQQKKGYLQKIFSQELRFKDENGNDYPEWRFARFKDFMYKPINIRPAINISKSELLTVKLHCKGIEKANINRVLKLGATNYYKRFEGQFIYGKQNFFNGAFDIVPKKFDGLYSSSDVPAFEINTEKIEPNYFISYISRPSFYKSKEKYSTGTGSKRIHENTVLNFSLHLPCLNEQLKIASFVCFLNRKIELLERKIYLIKKQKQALLQQMFI